MIDSGDPGAGEETYARLRARARRLVYERLALLSAVIWAVGTFILFVAIVPVVARPQPFIAVAMTVPLIPAALPWLFYGMISDRVARRWMAREATLDPTERSSNQRSSHAADPSPPSP